VNKETINIGGASGYWGDAAFATKQLLDTKNVDHLVYDYLAESRISILARAREANEDRGYALDFVGAILRSNLAQIASQNVKILTKAGGVNPIARGKAIKGVIRYLDVIPTEFGVRA